MGLIEKEKQRKKEKQFEKWENHKYSESKERRKLALNLAQGETDEGEELLLEFLVRLLREVKGEEITRETLFGW